MNITSRTLLLCLNLLRITAYIKNNRHYVWNIDFIINNIIIDDID